MLSPLSAPAICGLSQQHQYLPCGSPPCSLPQRGQTHRANTLHYNEPLCAGAARVDRGAQDSVSCAYLPRWRQIAKPALRPTIHNGPRPPPPAAPSCTEEVDVLCCGRFLLALRQSGGQGSPSRPPPPRPPLPSSHLILSVLIQVRDPDRGATVACFVTVNCAARTCTCGQDAGQRLWSPRGVWTREGSGCLAANFLWCVWGGGVGCC